VNAGLAGATAAIADLVTGSRRDALSDATLTMAQRAVADTIAVTLAARDTGTVRALARAQRGRIPAGHSSVLIPGVLASGGRAQATQAALINGTAAHALDYDDVADSIKGHPSAVLVPTVLAVAEEVDASGAAALEALAIGFQVECALADGLGIEGHYSRGWHSTAVLGVLAAASAASRLMGADHATARCALGIAASMAAGSRQNFGTMTKPLHAGLAASNGVLAAQLAGSGFTADAQQLESPLGFLQLYSGGEPFDPQRFHATLTGESALALRGLNVKRYPSCYDTSRTAEAAIWLAPRIDAAQIAEVLITVEPGGLRPLIHHWPQTGLEGKFSLEFVAAAALLDGRIGLSTFTDASVQRPAVRALVTKIKLDEQAVPPTGSPRWQQSYSVIRVTDRHGTWLERRQDVPHGHAEAPLSESELFEKFADCIAHSSCTQPTRSLFDRLRGLRDCPSVLSLDLASLVDEPTMTAVFAPPSGHDAAATTLHS
jgi:2-methylcitrate dehydratase PrpD